MNKVFISTIRLPKGFFKKRPGLFLRCVRLEGPLALVSLLLSGQDWDQARLLEAVASNQRQVVILDEPVPVYLVYLTAWVEEDGEAHFREDIYGHDQELFSALAESTAARAACNNELQRPIYLGGITGTDRHALIK